MNSSGTRPLDEILLTNAYLAYHLLPESEAKLRAILPLHVPTDMIIEKQPHLTFDFFGTLCADILDIIVLGSACSLVSSNTVAKVLKNASPKHFVSHASKEDIFYLPVRFVRALDWADFSDNIRSQGSSIRTPHITLLKSQKLSQDRIDQTLALLGAILPKDLTIDSTRIFCHGKMGNGTEFVQAYPKMRSVSHP